MDYGFNIGRNKDILYNIRDISDFRDLISQSGRLYKDRDAFLVKDTPGGKYRAIKYQRFTEDVQALGTSLMNLGVTGKKIAIIGENRYEWVIGYLAVVSAGGIIVPLDKELPVAEIKNLLVQTDIFAIIYSGKVEIFVEEAASGIETIKYAISMDSERNSGNKLSMKDLLAKGRSFVSEGKKEYKEYNEFQSNPDILSIILYTSGTTGLAKGVMLTQKNICSNVIGVSRYINLGENDTTLSILPIHHTYEFTGDILTSIYQGACVAFCEGLKHIVKNMAESRTTVLVGVPLIFESMHKKVWKKAESAGNANKLRNAVAISKALNKLNIKAARRMFKSIHSALGGNVRMFIVGAAAIDPNVVEDFNAMGIKMFQGYGLTECSPLVAVNKDTCYKAAAVGFPIPGTEVKIIDLDENNVGEIICKSDSVMLGYYENPEETAKVLKDGWLYTGDYGFFDKDGFLYISGRKKNVIVTKNGKNIFPEEVELYLNKSQFIQEVIVYGTNESEGDTLVCAEVLPDFQQISESMGNISEEAIRNLIKGEIDLANDKMSAYKRVKRFEIRKDEFEKTTTKKIKRNNTGKHN
ncbi:MAG: AMP-binding protein [Eubacteriales bacterium]